MFYFSETSKRRLSDCHPDLQRLFYKVIEFKDCSVLSGYRNKDQQNKAFKDGKTKAVWGKSNHNVMPSKAVDVMPYPIHWDDYDGLYEFAGFVKGIAAMLDIEIKWGGDFKSYFDGAHWEI